MLGRALLLALVLFAAGCSGPPAGDAPSLPSPTAGDLGVPPVLDVSPITTLLFEDIAGDATVLTSEVAAENADRHVDVTCGLFPEQPVQDACATLPSDASRQRVGGQPAPPVLDLRAVHWTENAANLTITFETESWDGDWDSMLPRPGSAVSFNLAWRSGEGEACIHGVVVTFSKLGNGVNGFASSQATGPCRKVVLLPAVAIGGAPARIEAHIPWAAVPDHAPGTELIAMRAWVSSDETDGTGFILGYRGNLRPSQQYNIDYAGQVVDDIPERALVALQRGPAPGPALPLRQTAYADVDFAPAVERRDLDIQRVDLAATSEFLTINVTLTEVDAAADARNDHQVYMQFDGNPNPQGIPTIYIVQSDVLNGVRTFTGYKLVAPDLHVEPFPFEGSVVPGSPGIVSFRMDRNDLEPFAEGDLLQRVSVSANMGSQRESRELAAGQGASYIATARRYDNAPGYLVVGTGPSGGADVEEVVLSDARGDAVRPAEALTMRNDGQSDVVRAELRVITPDMARVVLAMGDLGNVEVPPGYDAVFDGVAVQTPEGTFTIGYRLDTSLVPRYFCGGDRTVFAATPADPLGGTVTDIAGRLLPGPAPGTVGVIVFDVPASCFGALDADEDFRLSMTKVRAASYLIRLDANALGAAGITMLDSVESSEPLALTFRQAAPPGPPTFWEEPFGVESFWDIAGITLTALSSLVALALVVRRRTRFKRYLRRIEHIRHHTTQTEARAVELADLRRDLQRDLLRNRMPTDHFSIVEARLNPLLCRTRTALLSNLFPQMPDGLLARLETFISDGALSSHERSRFLTLAKPQMTAAQLRALEAAIATWG